MLRPNIVPSTSRATESAVRDAVTRLAADGEPRRAIAKLNAHIIALQCSGDDLPAGLIRLTHTITADWGGSRASAGRH